MVSSEDVLAGHQDLQELFETPVAPGTPITDIDTLFDEQPKPQDLAAPDASNNPDVCLFNHESGARNPILHVTRANGDLCSEWMDRGSNTQSVPPTRPPQLEPPIIRPRSSNAEHNYAAIKQTPIGTVLAPNAGPTRPLQSAAMINTSSANSRAYFNHSLASRSHYHVREPSNLRNEVHCEQTKYLPLAPMNRNDSGQLAQSMPTSHRLYNTQAQDRMTSMMQHRIHQNFQQSHVRTPLSQDFGLTSLPSDQIGGLQSQYPDLVQYSHQSSTASPYEVFDGNVGVHGNFMALPSPQQTIVFPDTPQMGQRSQFSGLMAAGSRKRQVTISGSSPRIKHEPGNGNLGAITIPQRALQAESNMSQEEEHEYIQALVSAMHDTTATEDNEGMLATWNKIRVKKAEKVQDVCIELLGLLQQAHSQNGTPLGGRKPVHQYDTFEERFNKMCETLRSQKTVCKHLLEAPYSHGVVDDPISAMQRVRNNRKVNHLKKQAIDLGREHMGEKGQGKGKPTLKIGNSEDSLGEEDNSADEALSEEDPDLQTAVVKVTPRKTRKAPHSSSEDGNYHSTGNFHTPKKAKRQSRSKYQVVGKEMVEVPKSTRNGTSSRRMKGQDLAQAMKKSLENAQQSQETVGNQDFSEWQSFNPQEHEYPYASTQPDAMLPQYQPIGHEFPLEHNQGPQHPVQSLDYSSSGTDGNLFFQDPAYDYASYFGHSNHRSH